MELIRSAAVSGSITTRKGEAGLVAAALRTNLEVVLRALGGVIAGHASLLSTTGLWAAFPSDPTTLADHPNAVPAWAFPKQVI